MSEDVGANLGRQLPYKSFPTVLAIVGALGFLAVGAQGILDPEGASSIFGVDGVTGPGLSFMAATGARNIGLALLTLGLVAIDSRKGLAFLLLAAGLIAALDFMIVMDASGAARAAKHAAFAVGICAFGGFLLRRG